MALINVVKATRRHFAMLQHKAAPDRRPIACHVGGNPVYLLWVSRNDRGALTRVLNTLRDMWPERGSWSAEYADDACVKAYQKRHYN